MARRGVEIEGLRNILEKLWGLHKFLKVHVGGRFWDILPQKSGSQTFSEFEGAVKMFYLDRTSPPPPLP